MIDPKIIEATLKEVRDQATFIKRLLTDVLQWPIEGNIDKIEDMSFAWTADELKAEGLDKHIADSQIWQFQKLDGDQPWGIFLIEFKNDKVFTTGRGLTGPLRKILRGLVPKARRHPNLPSWKQEHLLFICTHNYMHYSFAYFKAPKDTHASPLKTFGWGPEIPCRTACEFNLPALEWPNNTVDTDMWIREWQEAFDKEKLSKVFFDQYKALFAIFRKDLAERTKDLIWAHDYALQFLNRIMFINFIQRKRWIGNNPDFLRTFWQEYKTSKQPTDSFFDKWLKVMFFESFNNKFHGGHSHFPQAIREALALAPYLNGGLFKENELDNEHEFTVTDARFEQILMFFSRFNFTVSEDTPLDQDVAVDPEMIGTVYESLVNISEDEDRRGEAGIFYTPRIEIDMMCRLTLIDWLGNHLGEKYKSLLYEWIFAYEGMAKKTADERVQAEKLNGPLKELLENVKVVDPACGSGSFLVGMLTVLDDLRARLEKTSRSFYDRRKEIIGTSLYGVDVKDWACHVAELRLWLSLIIDAEIPAPELHVRREPLLPNFSFNIRCGDSLVQELGGIDMAHRRDSLDLNSALKGRLTKLKKKKAEFYASNEVQGSDAADILFREEVGVFSDLLIAKIQKIDADAKQVLTEQARNERPAATSLLVDDDILTDRDSAAKQAKMQDRKKQLDALAEEKRTLNATLQNLHDKAKAPFIWDIAFAEIFGDSRGGFDIVIGNPPYVRQENIANPDPHLDRNKTSTTDKKTYKSKLARSVYKSFPNYFDYDEALDRARRHELNKQSDLYIYFYFHGLSLLNDKGSFCFITSNSWLDVGYGADLQEFLLRRCHVKIVIDNKSKRSFKSADVNTVIVLLGSPVDKKAKDEASLANTARFTMFSVPFEDVISASIFEDIENATDRVQRNKYRIVAISQQKLLEEGLDVTKNEKKEKKQRSTGKLTNLGIKISNYTGDKWGARYLHSPDIYLSLMTKKSQMCKFETLAEIIQRNNMQDLKHTEHVLRSECSDGFPFLHSVKDVTSIRIKAAKLPKVIPTKGQKHASWLVPDLISNRFIGARLCFFEGGDFLINDSFFIAKLKHSVRKTLVLAIMNSTLSLFMLELMGRKNMGEGVLCIYGPELANHMIVDPFGFTSSEIKDIESVYNTLATREILPFCDDVKMKDRLELDKIIFDHLKLSKAERGAIYQAVVDLISTRLTKAQSLNPKKVEKRLDAVDSTTGIWLDSSNIIPDSDEDEE